MKEVQVVEQQVIYVPPGTETKPVGLGKVLMQVPAGREVMSVKGGLACIPQGRNERMPSGRKSSKIAEEGYHIAYQELKNAGYTVIGDPDALFEDDSSAMAEYVVSGAIRDLWIEVCYPLIGWGNTRDGSSTATVEVDWQVYNRLDKKIVLKKMAKGSANHKFSNDREGGIEAAYQAVGNSFQMLLADQKFHQVLSLESDQTAASPGTESSPASDPPAEARPGVTLVVKGDSGAKSAGRPIPDVPQSVVTVQEGASHGTGFLISSEGYIVTNRHVVGNLKHARVLFSDGGKADGVVLARDASRDVAIIKIAPTDRKPLVVNPSEPPVGEDVYAIGSPKDIRLAGSVTKGVVSGYRTFNKERWIQADAAINPGNSGGPLVDAKGRVVGISTLLRKDSQGIFFFGPIKEALERLGVTVN